MNKLKNFLRNWLGITSDMEAVSADMHMLADHDNDILVKVFEIFHAVPYAAGVPQLTAKDAAKLTNPNGIEANSLIAVLLGILIAARQGGSYLQVNGALDNAVQTTLERRGFKFEEREEGDKKIVFIIWS